jgi:hypothetical protein
MKLIFFFSTKLKRLNEFDGHLEKYDFVCFCFFSYVPIVLHAHCNNP